MATLNYNWQNVASWSVTRGRATTNFYIDAKLSRQDTLGNYSVIDTRLNSTIVNNMSGSGYNFQLTGSAGTSGTAVWYFANETILTGQFVHNHANDGTAYGVNIHAYVANTYLSFAQNIDAYVDLPQINRQANITSASDFNDEENPVIRFSNPAGYRMNARLEFGGTSIQRNNIPNTGSYTFELTNEERTLLRSKTPNSITLPVREIIATCYSGETENAWSYQDKTMTIINGNPSFSDFNYSTDLSALTGNNNTIITGRTTTTITIPTSKKAVALKGASISRYSFECGASTNLANYSSTDDVTALLTNCNSDIIKVTAIDSRGLETIVTKTVPNVKNYFSPTFVSGDVERKDGIEEIVYLDTKFNFWNYSFGSVRNGIEHLKYRVKESSSENYSQWFEINVSRIVVNKEEATLSNQIIFLDGISEGFPVGTAYNIQLQVVDKVDSVESPVYTLYDGQVAFSILKDSEGNYHIGINGMPDLDYTLKVHGTISSENNNSNNNEEES